MDTANFKKTFQLSALLPVLSAGVINAVILLSVQMSFAALVFSGDLQPFLPRGIGIFLLGTFLISIIVALTSSLPGMVGVPQDTPAAFMGLVAGGIAASLSGRDPEVVYSTVIGALMVGSLLTALVFFALGWFKASSFVRYIPYPVVGGFLAGTGYILVKGAVGIMVDIPLKLDFLPQFFTPEALVRWLPGMLFGLTLFLVLRRYNHFLIMPGAVILASALFYAVIYAAGISVQQAGADGWLLGPFPEGGLFQIFTPDNFTQIEWSAILPHTSVFVTMTGLSVISVLLNSSGLELVYKKDVDLDRELLAAGGATLAGGLIGCIVGYQTLGFSALANKFNARSRLTGVVTGLFFAFALIFGASVLSYFPKPVLGGMLFMLGLSFMAEWLVDYYKLLPRMDYALIWVMLFIIEAFGFLTAIGAGIVVAALLFVVSYGSISVVKNAVSGDMLHSQAGRSKRYKKALEQKGGQIYALRLDGYIFFGSIQRVLQNIRQRASMKDGQPLKYLLLDFKRVRRLDSSAVFGLARLAQLIEANGIAMTWTSLSDELRGQLENGGLLKDTGSAFSLQPTLDHGLEWCENLLLGHEAEENKVDFVDHVLSYMARSFSGLKRAKEYMERVEIPAGQYLLKQGEESNDLFFIEEGIVTAEFESASGRKLRLRSVKSGLTVGEVAFYLGGLRSASVKAEKASVVYRLTYKSLQKMEKESPALAAVLHEWLARILAERLRENNNMIESLLE